MRHMLGNLSPNYFERTKRYMMLRASQQGTDLTVSGTPPLSLPNSLGKPLKAWSVDVLPYQEGTGDPAPDNVRPIYGTDKLTITTAGKNLADPTNLLHGYYAPTSTMLFTSDERYRTFKQTLSAGTYTFKSYMADTYMLRWAYDDTNVSSNVNPLTFTLTDTAVVQICFRKTDTSTITEDFNIQLEYSSTATPYTPYLAPSQTVITLPQTVYGGELRMNEDGSGLLVLDRVYEEFTFVNPDTNSGYDSKIFTLANISTDGTSANGKMTNVVNEYAYTGTTYGAPHFYIVNNVCVIYLLENTYRGGDIQVCYPLAEPITYTLTTPPIPTPTGTATAWATAEDGTVDSMEVTYVGKA